jgi:glycosyl transferase family 87
MRKIVLSSFRLSASSVASRSSRSVWVRIWKSAFWIAESDKAKVYPILAVGLIVRLALAPISAHPWDVYVWFDTGKIFANGQNFYLTREYSYPPLWALYLIVVAAVYSGLAPWFGAHPLATGQVQSILGTSQDLGSPFITDWLFNLLVKLLLIAFDALLGFLIYRIVARRFGFSSRAVLAFAAFFLNPYTIWISSVWGMFDVLPTFFMLLGLLCMVDNHLELSGVVFGIATGLKYYPVLVLLVFVIGFGLVSNRHKLQRLLLPYLGTIFAFSIPFLLAEPTSYIAGILGPVTPGSPVTNVKFGNLSIWLILPLLGFSTVPLWFVILDSSLIAVFALAIGHAVRRRKDLATSPFLWLDLSILSILVFYGLFRIVNEQYFFWILPLLTIDSVIGRTKPVVTILMSGIVFGHIIVDNYSFFLPLLTVSDSLAWAIPKLPPILPFANGLGLIFWVSVVLMLWEKCRNLKLRFSLPKSGFAPCGPFPDFPIDKLVRVNADK